VEFEIEFEVEFEEDDDKEYTNDKFEVQCEYDEHEKKYR